MIKRIKRLSAVMLAFVMIVSMLAGCSSKPKAEDAQAYVKAVLDVICTGDYDHSVDLADIEEGSESQLRDELIDSLLTEFGSQYSIDDDVKADFKELLIAAFAKARYTVGDASATDDGGYDVTVSIEPLQLFAGVNDNLSDEVMSRAAEDYDSVRSMSDEELNNYVMRILIELLNKNLEDPQYDPAEDIIVHYGPLEGQDGVYGCSESEGEKLGEKIFSRTGIE